MASATDVDAVPRRSSTEKKPVVEPAFERLPDEIIEQYVPPTTASRVSLLLSKGPAACMFKQC